MASRKPLTVLTKNLGELPAGDDLLLASNGAAGARLSNGTFGLAHYMDSAAYYLLLTAANAPLSTSYTAARPFYVNLSSGLVSLGCGVSVAGGASVNGGLTTDSLTISAASFLSLGTTGAQPTVRLTSSPTDAKNFDVLYNSAGLGFRFVNDANTAASVWLSAARTGYAATSVSLTATSINLTGAVSIVGGLLSDISTVGSPNQARRIYNSTSGPADQKLSDVLTDGANWLFRLLNDAATAANTWLQVVRSGYTAASITLTATTINLNGTTKLNQALGTAYGGTGAATPAAALSNLGGVAASTLGAANGVATLDGSGKLVSSQIPASLLGAVVYQTTWNASTNSPALASGVGTKGFYYKVATAGTTTLDGISQWNVGDTAIFDGQTWDKIDGIANEVISVNGATGVVTLSTTQIAEGANLYFTNARAAAAAPVQSVAGLTGAPTLAQLVAAGLAPSTTPAIAGAPVITPGTDLVGRRTVTGNYGVVDYFDGANYFFLVTTSGNQLTTTYSGIRPWHIDLVSGLVSMDQGAAVGDLNLAGTGTMAGAWNSFQATVTASTGTITAASAVVRYKKFGRSVYFNLYAQITNNGSGAGQLTISLPFANNASAPLMLLSRDLNSLNILSGFIDKSAATIAINLVSTNAYPVMMNGSAGFSFGGVYEASA